MARVGSARRSGPKLQARMRRYGQNTLSRSREDHGEKNPAGALGRRGESRNFARESRESARMLGRVGSP